MIVMRVLWHQLFLTFFTVPLIFGQRLDESTSQTRERGRGVTETPILKFRRADINFNAKNPSLRPIGREFNQPIPFSVITSQLYNVTGEDTLDITDSLLENGHLKPYDQLRNSPHGRHLLLLSLLEAPATPYWEPRVGGRLRIYLPPSLAHPRQPPPPSQSCLLREVVMKNQLTTRDMLVRLFLVGSEVVPSTEQFSRFNERQKRRLTYLVDLALGAASYDSLLSLLVVLRDTIPSKLFIEAVINIIGAREDVGYAVPAFASILPTDFFPTNLDSDSGGRHKRQTISGVGTVRIRIPWNSPPYKTYPDSEPESRLWYYRENPLVNSHHSYWHSILSVQNSRLLNRRGEMFYFMHKQMLARYNVERFCLGLPLLEAFDRPSWIRPVQLGYDSRLSSLSFSGGVYQPRPANAFLPSWTLGQLSQWDRNLDLAIKQQRIFFNGVRNMNYFNGVDNGITHLGDAMEAIVSTSQYGSLHNTGHMAIAVMHGGSGFGVMANPNTAMRDPIFFRWHKYIDDIFSKYKNTLGQYEEADLNFPAIVTSSVSVQTNYPGVRPNLLYTYTDTDSIILSNMDFMDSSRLVNVVYDRINYFPFYFNISVWSSVETEGVGRIFLIPSQLRDNQPNNTWLSQVSIEMDRFLVRLAPGQNTISRRSTDSPHLNKASKSLIQLQQDLVTGRISREDFNWAGCGWPQEMAIPRGTPTGMDFTVVFMVSPLLDADRVMVGAWDRLSSTSWSWCGVRSSDGDVPDSRPMGFPFDRPVPRGSLNNLLTGRDGKMRGNFAAADVIITYIS